MENLSSWVATYALNAAWQAVLLVAAGWAASWFLRGARPRWQYFVWVAIAGLCCVLPVATAGRAAGRVQVNLPLDNPVESLIAGVVAVAALARGIRLFRGWRCARAWALAAWEADSPRVREVAGQCQCAMGLAAISIREAPGVPGPLTCGVRRPLILLPEGFSEQQSGDVLRAALAHEMAHVRRRDYAWNLALEILLLPLAWHPAVWQLRQRLDRTREMVCDEMAAQVLDGRRYARSLVAIAESVAAPRECEPALGVLDGGDLEARVRRLIHTASLPLEKLVGHSALAAGLLLAAVAAAATMAVISGWESRDVKELGAGPAVAIAPPPPPPPPPKAK